MSSERGNLKKTGAPKHPNKGAWKNVYHDTSQKTKDIVATEVSGVCRRCKDAIDWRIKYKKYKPLSKPKKCVTCQQKTVMHAYYVYCITCCESAEKCAKCGEKKRVILEPSLTTAQQASEDRQLQFDLEQLPERKRRTFLRLKEQGKLIPDGKPRIANIFDDDAVDSKDFDDSLSDTEDDDDQSNDGDTHRLPTGIQSDNVADKTCNQGEVSVDRTEDREVADGRIINVDAQPLVDVGQLSLQSDNCS